MEKRTKTEVVRSEMKKEDETKESMSLREYDFLTNAASTMDCTGLMYRVPEDDAERENYQSVYPYEPPKRKKE